MSTAQGSAEPRYAIYFAPAPGSALARFGERWFSGQAWRDWPSPGPERMAALLASPRHYGFHATLKPPFALATGADVAVLEAALARLAAGRAGFFAAPLRPTRLGRFIALCPAAADAGLDALAADCVRAFDGFRAAPPAAEMARRRAAGLSARQESLLAGWGYPYVFDEFCFHMTLTGPVADGEASAILAALEPLTRYLGRRPLAVREICLFAQTDGTAPFTLLRRFAFRDSCWPDCNLSVT